MNRLDELTALRDRIDQEIARERAYQRRIADLREQALGIAATEDERERRLLVAVATWYSVTIDQMLSTSRAREVVAARAVTSHLLREAGRSLPDIGALLGKDHTTVMHGCRRVAEDEALRTVADTIAATLAGTGEDRLGVA